jgi:hypothetical protein
MPLIRIEYDDAKVPDVAAEELSKAVRDIVSQETGIADVFVYANSAHIKIQIAPIEVFVQISEQKIDDFEGLFMKLRTRVSEWKKERSFPHPINFTLIPMHWQFAIDI